MHQKNARMVKPVFKFPTKRVPRKRIFVSQKKLDVLLEKVKKYRLDTPSIRPLPLNAWKRRKLQSQMIQRPQLRERSQPKVRKNYQRVESVLPPMSVLMTTPA